MYIIVSFGVEMIIIESILRALQQARRAAKLSQHALAARAGLSRMTVQKVESGSIDPRLSTVTELLRALGLEIVLVPGELKPAVGDFLRSGGRVLAQPPGVGAPPSIVEVLARTSVRSKRRPPRRRP
jgi:transcriptional regulator with XRE-family HTH domain